MDLQTFQLKLMVNQNYFILNVSGDYSLGSSQVVLTGGVTGNHVLWNFPVPRKFPRFGRAR